MTWHIHIKGQVQGVGFRPFVYRLAIKHDISGWVNNTTDGVHILFNAESEKALQFYKECINEAPPIAKILHHYIKKEERKDYLGFQIIESSNVQKADVLITPDFAMCSDCNSELFDQSNRRYQYPFITCTNCGPRYSIIKDIPYDRHHTTMDKFPMCPDCQAEYNDPANRRYFSQTNSCPSCKIELNLFDANKNVISNTNEEIFDAIPQLWSEGKIIAIKGIGGYLLTCDASNAAVISQLRKRKHRPSKPFAVMTPNIALLKHFALINEKEEAALSSYIAPILLLNSLKGATEIIAFDEIAPGLSSIGVMLPYNPLFEILLHNFGKSIIATSGNVSGSPIIYKDEEALDDLSRIADYVVTNNREIMNPQDDSVMAFTSFSQHKVIYRRSRGYAPTFVAGDKLPAEEILCLGAMMKSSFTLLHDGNVYLSQYLGDLEHYEAIRNYKFTIQHYLKLFRTTPEIIICDQHPGYPSTHYAEELSKDYGVPLHRVQHHEAHFAAVLAEHQLINSKEKIMGVIWDGTGFGSDGHIWGGEFFTYQKYAIERIAHLDYFPQILGDKMAKEPRISALSLCFKIPEALPYLEEKFTATEWHNYNKILSEEQPFLTSSAGRLFDAVASLLGLCDLQTYEGEAAIYLEHAARRYLIANEINNLHECRIIPHYMSNYSIFEIVTSILKDMDNGIDSELIALKFHITLVALIKKKALSNRVKKIVFSGGVYQNTLLLDLIDAMMSEDYMLYFHEQLSANDENISYGQLIHYLISQSNDETVIKI